jgi:hypothetical protein
LHRREMYVVNGEKRTFSEPHSLRSINEYAR